MRKSNAIFYWRIILVLLLYSSCSVNDENGLTEEQANQEEDKYYQFRELILTDYDFSATIKVPDETAGIGASFKPVISHEEDFKWIISAGPNFSLYIEDYGDYDMLMDEFKKKIKTSNLFKIDILGERNGIICYSRQIKASSSSPKTGNSIKTTYHLYAVKHLGGVSYEIKNKEEGDTKKAIELMEKSVESLKLIK